MRERLIANCEATLVLPSPLTALVTAMIRMAPMSSESVSVVCRLSMLS